MNNAATREERVAEEQHVALLKEAKALREKEPQKARELAEDALLRIGAQSEFENDKAEARFMLGMIYSRTGELELGIQHPKIAQTLFDKHRIALADAQALNLIGFLEFKRANFSDAIQSHQASFSAFERLNEKHGMASALNYLGSVLFAVNDDEGTERHHQKSLALFRELGDLYAVAMSLRNNGKFYKRFHHYDKALEAHQESLAIRQDIGDKRGVAGSSNDIGIILVAQSRFYDGRSIGWIEPIGRILFAFYSRVELGATPERNT